MQDGFKEAIAEANPPELVAKYRKEIDLYASWLDQGHGPRRHLGSPPMFPARASPWYSKGRRREPIADKTFAQMYFRYNLGEDAR